MKAAKDGRHGHRDATLLIALVCGRQRCATSNGAGLSSAAMLPSTFAGRRTAHHPFIHFVVTSSEHCASCNATRRPHSYSRPSEAHRSPPTPLTGRLRQSVFALVCPSQSTPTCRDMLAATHSLMTGTIRDASSRGLVIGASSHANRKRELAPL
jgi:hypothetical protein